VDGPKRDESGLAPVMRPFRLGRHRRIKYAHTRVVNPNGKVAGVGRTAGAAAAVGGRGGGGGGGEHGYHQQQQQRAVRRKWKSGVASHVHAVAGGGHDGTRRNTSVHILPMLHRQGLHSIILGRGYEHCINYYVQSVR
jgi:hypothetical protein